MKSNSTGLSGQRRMNVSMVLGDVARMKQTIPSQRSSCLSADPIQTVLKEVAGLAAAGKRARRAGDEPAAMEKLRAAFQLCTKSLEPAGGHYSSASVLELLKKSIELALGCGETAQARELVAEAEEMDPEMVLSPEWSQFQQVETWPDEWLIAAIGGESPDTMAFDALVKRYGNILFARCQYLTGNRTAAADLSQDAWTRILRSRHCLKPGGNFPGYLQMVATNLWRDNLRSICRAGNMATTNLASLHEALPGGDDDFVLMDTLSDAKASSQNERALLSMDINQAIAKLPPSLRDVLVARYFIGESCLEIGRSYGRTQQTINSWIRLAIRKLKTHLEDREGAAVGFGEG